MAVRKRVIHILEDGRKKYSTHNGVMELYLPNDIASIKFNQINGFNGAFTSDFQKYDTSYCQLRKRYPKSSIIRVKSIIIEDFDAPIDSSIIF
ncbi:MAG: hypothetical protein R3Y49_03000 [Rikenellaceae bacterium]